MIKGTMHTELKPIDRKRLYESIVDQMRQLIVNGTWKPGDRLPSERELTEIFSVGRTSVREALRILEAFGFIEIHAGDGSYVKEMKDIPKRINELATIFTEPSAEDEYMSELMEARELIESQVAFLAAQSATKEDIAKLDEIIQRQEDSILSGGDGIQENIEFHLCLTEITGNRVLVLLQNIFSQVSIKAVSRYFLSPIRREDSIEGHKVIANAIREGRASEAHKLMLDHLRHRYSTIDRK